MFKISKWIGNKKGFTLIELMIVVAIIGILAAIAIPNFMRFQAKSKQAEAKTNLGAIGTTAESWRTEKDTYVIVTISDLGWAPTGTLRFSYWYDAAGTAVNFVTTPASYYTGALSEAGCDRAVVPSTTQTVAAAAGTFTTGAKGQVDTDATCDEWFYTNTRSLTNTLNDVGQ